MNIAVIGSGGREHAIAWKLAQSAKADEVFVLPGNGGTQNNVNISPTDFESIKQFCLDKKIELIFVGPEDPLAQGIVDFFADSAIKVFGPDKQAAQMEGSKIWSKQFMKRYGVATADFWIPEDTFQIRAIAQEMEGQAVVKYDGLAAGKGVFVCSSTTEIYEAIDEIHSRYGADAPYLIERKMGGQEVSIIGFTDGQAIQLLQPSQDHKPAYDGDAGPNTGGMGAYCPVPFCDTALLEKISETIVQPTLRGIQAEGFSYKGVIYFGIMVTDDGPELLEYNVRFGDPETEVLLLSLKSDLLDLTLACLNGTLADFQPAFHDGYFVDVVLASGGYPGSYEKGKEISGLGDLPDDALVFHAGTRRENGELVTSGGRVLNLVGQGATLEAAIESAYALVKQVRFDKMYFRKDIAQKGLKDKQEKNKVV